MSNEKPENRYSQIIERIFLARYKKGASKVSFERTDIEKTAAALKIKLPKNLGDVIYSFRFRTAFPASVTSRAPKGQNWLIRLVGRSKYCFVAQTLTAVTPRADMATTKIPDATPGIIIRYALTDEQALLAKLRYNRLIDIFTGITCYPLQSHLRTTVTDMGQVETDELYIGIDHRGAHFVFPVQAKGGKDKQNIVQIEQDFALCKEKFPGLLCRPIAAQFMSDEIIALFEFEQQDGKIAISDEKHYRLVPEDQLSPEDLAAYRSRRT